MRHQDILNQFTKLNKPIPKQREIAEALDYDIGKIGKRATRNSEYTEVEILQLEKFFDIKLSPDSWVKEKLQQKIIMTEVRDEFAADYYPDVFGSCGNGTFVLSECKEQISVPKKIVESFSSYKTYSVINAYGDSMMPYIHDKDLLVVEHYTGEQITDNRIYVFRFGDKIFVKRLVLNINQLVIKSDNTMYQPITIELNNDCDFQIIGKIVGLMRGTE